METVFNVFHCCKANAPVWATTNLFLQFVPLELNLSGLSTEIMHHSLLSLQMGTRSKYLDNYHSWLQAYYCSIYDIHKSRVSYHFISFIHLAIYSFIHSAIHPLIRVIIYLFIYFQITIVMRYALLYVRSHSARWSVLEWYEMHK